ncbi:MAG: hypothetical protein A4S12_11940 [Proteobacteria bacterium SG_bin5]|nr:hypothetical protein [Sphingomonas sp.]OQW39019.1 MAG: hypothetical protein A4S12_11940 [Proteobacteria bacterium SG_bin5]
MRLRIGIFFALRMTLALIVREVSRFFELIGDDALNAGDRSEALFYHCVAIVFLLCAFACYIWALLAFLRSSRAIAKPAPAIDLKQIAELPQAEPSFDADVIMARYLAKRQAASVEPAAPAAIEPTPPPPPPPRPGFGRKGKER